MQYFALDPGNEKSGWIEYTPCPTTHGGLELVNKGVWPNEDIREMLASVHSSQKGMLAIETPKPQGQMVQSQLLETCIEIGRFLEIWGRKNWSYVFRSAVKHHLCGAVAVKDKNVAQALKDRFGGEPYVVGGKKCAKCHGKRVVGRQKTACPLCRGTGWDIPPGPLHGVSSHMWPALAVACYIVDNPQCLQAILMKPQQQQLQDAVGNDITLTPSLRREHGLAGRKQKKGKNK